MFAKLRKAISTAKLVIDVAKAKQRLRYPKLQEAIFTIADVPVIVNNDSVLVITGVRGHLPCGAAFFNPDGSKTIAITEGAVDLLSQNQLNALISHEYYHLLSNDRIEKNHYKELEAGKGFAMEKEYAADAFALSEGTDILGFLEVFQRTVADSLEIRLRIERIKELFKASI